MTDEMRAAAARALALVGNGYIYGAKGQICSPVFRRQQAAQYPQQASNILGMGAKWDGMPVWDCAQLTRTVAASAGVTLVSGATSQWNTTRWARSGEIETLPEGETVFVYRREAGSKATMAHTGVALGDGTCVHARGTAYGVVRQRMEEHAWTHWASPWASDDGKAPSGGADGSAASAAADGTGVARNAAKPQEGDEARSGGDGPRDGMDDLFEATVTAQSGSTVNLRSAPEGVILKRIPIGTVVLVSEEADGWSRVRADGLEGWMQSAFLLRAEWTLETLGAAVDDIRRRLSQAGL